MAELSEPAVFRRAYEDHRPAMVAAATAVLHDNAAAEDVVQDVFLDLWRMPWRYDPARGALRRYLTMLAKHRALDRWRSRGVATAATERARLEAAVAPATGESPDEQLTRRETARAVREAVDVLPRSQREVVLLAYGGGLSGPEVATVTNAPLGTAKSRLRLGLRAAGKTLAANGLV